MSHNIPFDIQADIIQRLPIKSLVRSQCVSKQWKSHISSTKFIKGHHINEKQSQCHLLVRHKLNYTSIIINDTFPNQKSSVSLPPPLSLMNNNNLKLLNSVNGLLCFYGFYAEFNTYMVVLWNPTIRKTVGIPIPTKSNKAAFGFGFCRDSIDPKLVKIIDGNAFYNEGVSRWKVDVFTLSSRVWKTVFTGKPPIGACLLNPNQVCVDGIIYWLATYSNAEYGIVSYDLKNEEFGKVCLPDSLLLTYVAEVNGSLAALERHYDHFDDVLVNGVWMMDSLTKSFAKMFNVRVPGHTVKGVFWFRKNSEVIIEVEEDEKNKSKLEVYDPSSGRINDIGINGLLGKQRGVNLYMETLLLLDEPSSIISSPPKKKTNSIVP